MCWRSTAAAARSARWHRLSRLPLLGGVGLHVGVASQFGVQLLGVVTVALWAAVATVVLIKVTQALVGLRVSADEELTGLDQAAHGESGYKL